MRIVHKHNKLSCPVLSTGATVEDPPGRSHGFTRWCHYTAGPEKCVPHGLIQLRRVLSCLPEPTPND